MTRRDSVAILNQYGVAGPQSEELAAELGDHPLALMLISRSLTESGKSPADILQYLSQVRPHNSTGSLGAILSMSVAGLASDARALLETLCLDAAGSVGAPPLAHPAIRELSHAGLVQVDHLEAATQISIHPLVQRYVNDL